MLSSDLDLDALEDLLRALPAESRPNILRFARDWSLVDVEECLAAFPEVEPLGAAGRRTFLLPDLADLSFNDPGMQGRLDRVLAPRRDKQREGPPET